MQGWGNSPLTELGIQQAVRHGEFLNRQGVDAIHASDLDRVRETVKHINRSCDIAPSYHETLREFNMGIWEGQQIDDIKAKWPDTYKTWRNADATLAAPEGESKAEVAARVGHTLNCVISEAKGSVAFVTHGGTTRVLLELLIDLDEEQQSSIRIPNNVIHKIDLLDSGRYVTHFRDGGDAIEGICTSMDQP